MSIIERSGGRKTLSSQVVETLRREIEDGDYAAGDKLPAEPVLVERFGFSRTVIREAIAALRADGLVESRHGVGVFVLGPRQRPEGLELFTQATDKISDIIEELELRIGIEVEAAGLAALRSSPPRRRRSRHSLKSSANWWRRACRPMRPISIFTWRSRKPLITGGSKLSSSKSA